MLDAFGHLKAIAVDKGCQALLLNANIGQDDGVVDVTDKERQIYCCGENTPVGPGKVRTDISITIIKERRWNKTEYHKVPGCLEKEEAEKQDTEWETNYKVQLQEKEKNHVK